MILAILQARTTSSRLPGKILKPILGEPMLVRQIERIKRSSLINQLLVATSTDETDDVIQSLCESIDIRCFRGSLHDVLDRFYQAAKLFNPKHIVRFTGDCPLLDPDLINRVIDFHLRNYFDYTSNALKPTYPDGLDTEVFQFHSLEKVWRAAKLKSEREHVTSYIYTHPDQFNIGSFEGDVDLSALRWTVDEELDFILITKIYQALYPRKLNFGMEDILEYLDRHPELKTLNSQYKRNEGYQKSLMEDKSIESSNTR